MCVVLLQCAVVNILCNDSINRILHLYYCKFPYEAWGGSPIGIQTPDHILSHCKGPLLTGLIATSN